MKGKIAVRLCLVRPYVTLDAFDRVKAVYQRFSSDRRQTLTAAFWYGQSRNGALD